MKNYAKIVFQGSSIIFILSIIGTLIAYVTRMYLSRELTVIDFGLFYSLVAFVGLFAFLRNLGFNRSLTRHIAEFLFKKEYSKIKTSVYLVFLIQMGAAIAVMSPFIFFPDYFAVNFFHTLDASFPLQILALSFIVSTFITIYNSLFQGYQKVKCLHLPEFLRLVFVLVFVFLLIGHGVAGASFAYLIAAILVPVVLFLPVLKILKSFKEYRIDFDSKLAKSIVLFALPVFFGSAATAVINRTDTLMITYFLGLYHVGVYEIALATSRLLWIVIGSLTPILFPVVSEIWVSNNKAYLSNVVSTLLKFIFLFMLPLVVVFISFPNTIISLFFTSKYLGGTAALSILCIGAVFYVMFTFSNIIVSAINKPSIAAKIGIIAAVINFLLNLILVPLIGIIGAAITSVLSYFTGFILLSFYVKKQITYSFPYFSWLKTFLISVVLLVFIGLLKLVVPMPPVLAFFIILLLAVPFFALLLRGSRIISKKDMDILKHVLPEKIYNVIYRIIF